MPRKLSDIIHHRRTIEESVHQEMSGIDERAMSQFARFVLRLDP